MCKFTALEDQVELTEKNGYHLIWWYIHVDSHVFLSIFFASPSPVNHTKKTPNLENKKPTLGILQQSSTLGILCEDGWGRSGDLFLFFEGEQMCERVCFFWLKENQVWQVETECSHRFYCINILPTVHRYTDTECKYDINMVYLYIHIHIWRVRPLFGILFPSPLNFQWSMGMCLGLFWGSLERHQPWAEIGQLQSP